MLNLRIILFVGCWGLLVSKEEVEWNRFLEFVSTYNKEYGNDPNELTNRFKIFKESLRRHKYLNSLEGSTVYGVNVFSDLTVEEFKSQYLSGLLPGEVVATKVHSSEVVKNIPKLFDWRDQGKVSSIKDQQKCGSCWAFSISEGLESCYAITYRTTVIPLSTQQFISCDKDTGSYGCSGGTLRGAVDWLKGNVTIVPDVDYPFTSGDGSQGNCITNLPTHGVKLLNYTVKDYIYNELSMAQDLQQVSPLSVTVNANIWQDYRGGIIRYHCTNTSIDHAVQIVGYDMTGDPPYWIVRNTWGTQWGVNGYLYIAMNKNLCGLAQTVYSFNSVRAVNL